MKFLKLDRFIKHKALREWTEAIIFAVVVAFVIRSWLYSPFRVPTGSMIPTIDVGDQLIADMNAYGFVIPFTDKKIATKEIKRGDIVIFPNPANPQICDSSLYSAWNTVSALVISLFDSNYVPTCIDYIKRIVAVGGDDLKIVGEQVFINNQPESGYAPYFNPNLEARNVYYEQIVPEGKVFLMGDNRRDSHDARFWHIDGQVLSFIDNSKVRAKAKWIYFSVEPSRNIFNGGIRWERMFETLK